MMKLLHAIEVVTADDMKLIESIRDCISERVDWLNEREPESSGMVYDEWSEKESEMSYILDYLENLLNEDKVDADELNAAMLRIEDYQMSYGGLSRLKVY